MSSFERDLTRKLNQTAAMELLRLEESALMRLTDAELQQLVDEEVSGLEQEAA
jgi:hypothetical protein